MLTRLVPRDRQPALLLVILLVWAMGCASYREIEIGEVADHDRVRVTRTDGSVSFLYDPEVRPDTIGGRKDRDSQVALWIALDDVERIQTGGNQAAGTAVAVVGGIALVLVIVTAASDPELKFGS